MTKPKIVCVVGPTASGKSALALALARRFSGEIVSADSMQIYRHMDVGTAKPSKEEQAEICHHLVDIVEPTDSYTLADFMEDAEKSFSTIFAKKHLPVLCGGTGLYVSSLVDNVTLTPSKTDGAYRAELMQIAETQGGGALQKMLYDIDPETAQALHENDIKRLCRALEIYHDTGLTMTEQRKRSRLTESPYEFYMVGLCPADRAVLYERIDKRVDDMMAHGLENEVRSLFDQGLLVPGTTAAQAIGYKEFTPYFAGECTLDDVVATIKQESRRYAKRQLTWFRRDTRIHWVTYDTTLEDEQTQRILQEVQRFTEE